MHTPAQIELLTDARLKAMHGLGASAVASDINQPESIAEILALPHGKNQIAVNDVGTTGYLQLDGHMPLYITSPQLTSFGSTLGPRGEHMICKKVNAQSLGFGGQSWI